MPRSDLRLLALDGGVRGLSALMILEQLMGAVDPDASPKPCDYFDMIGDTSTGEWVVTRSVRHEKSCLPGSWIQRGRQGV
jgi:patatin-like phospholipase/acyl hydrolase